LVKHPSRIALVAVLACVLFAAVFHTAILGAMGGYLVSAAAPEKADIAVVLAGDSSGNRILKAGDLVRAGYVPRALVSGPSGMYGFHESELAIRFAEHAGYPESYFLAFPNEARSTQTEAEAILPELRRQGVHTFLLVTSDYHTHRAGRIYRAMAPDLRCIVVASPDPYFSADGWWKNREGRKTFAFESMKTVSEWFGL
jgi:uncharacterized SAM-binding protein YcdF (DUF218 family)